MKRLLMVAVLLAAVSQAQAIGSRCAAGYNYVRGSKGAYSCVLPLTRQKCLPNYDLKQTAPLMGQLRAYSCIS